jgi:hypothetical protein
MLCASKKTLKRNENSYSVSSGVEHDMVFSVITININSVLQLY